MNEPLILIAAALAAGGVAVGQTPQPASPASPAPANTVVVDPRAVASRLGELLEGNYVYAEVGRRYADALRAHAAAGRYDHIREAGPLGERLTADLRAVAPDNHLRVMPDRGGPMVRRVPAGGGGPGAAGPRIMLQPGAPPPIEVARWIAPGIAFIRFNVFPGAPETIEAARRFMEEHADARTIIFDIRTHGGGGVEEMDAIFPYLFSRETVLVAMETRASVAAAGGEPMVDRPTLRQVAGAEGVVRREHVAIPHSSERRLFDAQVFVLTSGFTGSAAEHFALAMKHTRRATLIGESTGGANHYGGVRPLGGGLAAFIPVGRTVDPDTGLDWEGTGIAPDVGVPAERALIEALVRCGIPAVEAERLSDESAPTRPMRRITPRT